MCLCGGLDRIIFTLYNFHVKQYDWPGTTNGMIFISAWTWFTCHNNKYQSCPFVNLLRHTLIHKRNPRYKKLVVHGFSMMLSFISIPKICPYILVIQNIYIFRWEIISSKLCFDITFYPWKENIMCLVFISLTIIH